MKLADFFVLSLFIILILQSSVAQRPVSVLDSSWNFAKDCNEQASLPYFNEKGWQTTLQIQ